MIQEKIIRFPELRERTGLSRATIFRLERNGNFPKRRKIAAHSIGWILEEIIAWIDSRSIISNKEDNQ